MFVQFFYKTNSFAKKLTCNELTIFNRFLFLNEDQVQSILKYSELVLYNEIWSIYIIWVIAGFRIHTVSDYLQNLLSQISLTIKVGILPTTLKSAGAQPANDQICISKQTTAYNPKAGMVSFGQNHKVSEAIMVNWQPQAPTYEHQQSTSSTHARNPLLFFRL